MIYLFAKYWSGAMNVASMRVFSDYEKVVKHVKTQIKTKLDARFFRVYEFDVDGGTPPKLINNEILKQLVLKRED